MSEELSAAPNSSIQQLISKLERKSNGAVVFNSSYFGVPIPLTNVVITCTSNCGTPADDVFFEQKPDCINYQKVKYGSFKDGYVESAVRAMYEEELKRVFPEGNEEMLEKILTSDPETLSKAARHLRKSFENQVKHCNLGNMARQRVATFIAEGGGSGDM